MAIQKTSTVQNGVNGPVTGNFWVTRVIYMAPDFSHSRVTMALYTNQSSFEAGDGAIYQNDYLLVGEANQLFRLNLITITEPGLIQFVPDFAGGTYIPGV